MSLLMTPNEIRLLAYSLFLLQMRTVQNLQHVKLANVKRSSHSPKERQETKPCRRSPHDSFQREVERVVAFRWYRYLNRLVDAIFGEILLGETQELRARLIDSVINVNPTW
jgi:hypothetical protein